MKKTLWFIPLGLISVLEPLVGATITTATGSRGADGFLRFDNSTLNSSGASILVKMQLDSVGETSPNDRLTLLRFDLSSLTTKTSSAQIRLQTYTVASNQFEAGQRLQLYGIPESLAGVADTQENFTASLTGKNFVYGTGTNGNHPKSTDDTTLNRVDDTLAPLLATYTVPAATVAGDVITFSSADLSAWINQDTNGYVSFIVATTTSTVSNTPAFHSRRSTTSGAVLPTLITTDVPASPTPEPTSTGLLVLAGFALRRRRRA